MIFLHGIWRHIKEFGIEGQIPRISSPVKLEKRCKKTSGPKTTRQSKYHLDLSLMKSYHAAKLELDLSLIHI